MSKPVVLIVEDDYILRLVLKKMINRLDHSSFEATNGEEALELLKQHNEISHVFLDLNMPVLDGYGFLQFVNSGNKHSDLNIYITSVTDEPEFMTTIRQRNIDISNVKRYNQKPCHMQDIAECLVSGNTLLQQEY